MSGDCQEIVRRLPLQSRFFFSLLRQETTRMLSSGESELWRLQVQSYECWKKTSENPWFCVFCVLFFSNGSGILTSCCISIRSWHIECHRNGGISFFVPWQRWKRGTLCLGLPRQFVLRSCLTLQDPSCRQGPNLSASFSLSMPSMLQSFTMNAQRTCRSMVFSLAYLTLPETRFEHGISCKGTVLFNATRMKTFCGIL